MAVSQRAVDRQHLEDCWHAKLDAIRRRYASEPKPEVKAEYLRLLAQFADRVLRGKRPRVY